MELVRGLEERIEYYKKVLADICAAEAVVADLLEKHRAANDAAPAAAAQLSGMYEKSTELTNIVTECTENESALSDALGLLTAGETLLRLSSDPATPIDDLENAFRYAARAHTVLSNVRRSGCQAAAGEIGIAVTTARARLTRNITRNLHEEADTLCTLVLANAPLDLALGTSSFTDTVRPLALAPAWDALRAARTRVLRAAAARALGVPAAGLAVRAVDQGVVAGEVWAQRGQLRAAGLVEVETMLAEERVRWAGAAGESVGWREAWDGLVRDVGAAVQSFIVPNLAHGPANPLQRLQLLAAGTSDLAPTLDNCPRLKKAAPHICNALQHAMCSVAGSLTDAASAAAAVPLVEVLVSWEGDVGATLAHLLALAKTKDHAATVLPFAERWVQRGAFQGRLASVGTSLVSQLRLLSN